MRQQTHPWLAWLAEQRFSTWETLRVPYEGSGRVRRQPWRPAKLSETFQGGWIAEGLARKPATYLEPEQGSGRAGWLCDRLIEDDGGRWRAANKLDSADFGNATIYCAIGAFGVEPLADLSRIIKVCGPRKRDIPLSPPHYDLPGGFEYRRIDATRLLLYGCSYRIGSQPRAFLFRELPRQRQQRILGTAIIVTTVENDDLRITMIDFAPRDPDLSLACRLFVAVNLGSRELGDLAVHHLLVNSRSSWDVEAMPQGLVVMDREDGTGLRLYAPAFGQSGAAELLDGRPEQAWQRLDLPLALPTIRPGSAESAWSLLVPTIQGGDPDEQRAMQELERFDAMQRLEATAQAWTDWSARVRATSDQPILSDLADNLQVLLKTHEGGRGYHLGTTYQRHTHSWSRDNYLMQRGLLAVGRIDEAARNLEGFLACWKQSGIACGYNVFTRANWVPRATAEICAYLVLMARDLELWTGAPPPSGVWEMMVSCADTLALNSRGLVGFDGDEIWFWEMDPALFVTADGRGLRDPESLAEFSVLDNCWLALAALAYAEETARSRGEPAKAAAWGEKLHRIETSLEDRMWEPDRGVYTAFLYPDGTRYPGPLTNGYCTPSFFGVPERHAGSFRTMALACGRALATPEGVVKGNTDTEVFAGMSPSFYLHALGSAGEYEKGDRYLEDLVRALPSSGGTWEYCMVDLPYTGTDKRRGGDSGVLLASLMDYLVGFRPTRTGFTLRPHVPACCTSAAVAGLRWHDSRISVTMDPKGSRVEIDGKETAYVPAGTCFAWHQEGRA